MFNNSTGFKFRGGHFYNVSGDVHLQTHQHLTIQGHNPHEGAPQIPSGSTRALEDGHELPGIVRNLRPARSAPYDIAFRPHLPASSSDHYPIPHEFNSSPSTSRSLSFIGPGWSPAGPLPDTPLPDREPAHEYPNYSGASLGGRSHHNNNSLPRSDGEPAQSTEGIVHITAQNVNQNHHYESGKRGIDILHRHVALEALYDSAESFPQPRCHPETRTKILDDLYEWAVKSSSEENYSMRWLYGPAGAGKSAIMQTLCQRLQAAGPLGGSFFFKRGHATRGNAKVLFATLAYQLALHNRQLKGPISQSAGDDPSVVGRGMDVQLRQLIIEPCQSLEDAAPLILLIDGLDECENAQVQQTILLLIGNAVSQHPSTFRFLVASRPEPHIRETLAESSFRYNSVNIKQSFEDVQHYFRDEFARIHREHSETMGSIPTPWPSSNILKMLVEKSSGYFIYASTVIKFIDDKNFRPTDQLDIIQNLANDDSDESDLPFEPLDKLYTQILCGVPTRSRSKLCNILCIIANFRLSICHIEQLLDLRSGDVRLTLRNVHSVLDLGSEDNHITVHHASFLDFLLDRQRSSIFYIGPDSVHHTNVAHPILKVLSWEVSDPQAGITWNLEKVWIKYITLIPPSAALVPLIGLVNPDFFWWGTVLNAKEHALSTIERLLTWLKRIGNSAEDLVQQWEEYHFMFCYEQRNTQTYQQMFEAYGRGDNMDRADSPQLKNDGLLQVSVETLHALLTQSPHLARILQARWLLYHPRFTAKGLGVCHLPPQMSAEIFFIRILLDLSWVDMRAAICSLRPILDEELPSRKIGEMLLILPTLCSEIHPESLTSRDIALGFLRLMQKICRGALLLNFW
ncbi:hypothetical protein C8R44DRAFT_16520 [Mycena epipterygia]|nr:hypothetical protein C8R44DRAFT_16520 [Mycena epipterygia]